MTRRLLLPILPALFFFGCGPSHAPSEAGSTQARDDTPPVFQPRQFSDFAASLGGTIPFPPEKFVQGLLSLDDQSSITSEIFPHGRSLERAITDFRDPRTTMVWQGGPIVAPYYLYLAYTPNAEELEVIAWNWEQRHFDFAVVQDYAAGKTPQTVPASRAVCMACHQDGGPIFAQFPWNETTRDGDIKSQLASQAQDSLSRFLLGLSSDASVRVQLDASVMDFQVASSTTMLQSQNVCTNACGGDLECRKGILLAALFENVSKGGSANLSSSWLSTMGQAMQTAWPSDGFGILDNSIADRTVTPNLPFQFAASEDPLLWRDPVSVEDPVEGTGSLLLAGYSQCWNFTPEQTQALRSWGTSRLDSAMATDPVTALVKTWLPSESAILSSISTALTSPENAHSPGSVPWTPPAKDPGAVSDPNRPRQPTTALFGNYCGYCHSSPENRPPVLPLADLHALGAYVGSAGRTVKALLDPAHPVMPPRGAPQPTVEERQQMLSDL